MLYPTIQVNMSVWVREQLQSAKHTYNEPGRDVTWTAINALVTWTAINALVISSDLCSV